MESSGPPRDSFFDLIERPDQSSTTHSRLHDRHDLSYPAHVPLDRLLAELRAARLSVSQERGAGRHFTERSLAQATLLDALEAYAAGLASAGHPLPYRIRDELFIHRQLARVGRSLPD